MKGSLPIKILREMEENELLTRKVYPEVPPRVEYTLTDIGYSLKTLLDDMDKAIETLKQKNIEMEVLEKREWLGVL